MIAIPSDTSDLMARVATILRQQLQPAHVHRVADAFGVGEVVAASEAWPVFSQGFYRSGSNAGRTFAFFELHKGLDRAARGYMPGNPLRMDRPERWQWSHWVESVRNGDWDTALKQVLALTPDQPLTVRTWIWNGLEPGFDPYRWEPKHAFHYQMDADGRLSLAEPDYTVGPLEALAGVSSFADWLGVLSELPEYRWYWVSVLVGWETPRHPEDRHTVPGAGRRTPSAVELWERLWQPLLPWYGPAPERTAAVTQSRGSGAGGRF